MFYQCPKCKKIWQYPIEKCPNCFLGLERLLTKTAKVIGVSKVNIPTLLHPKVPYFVLVLEDKEGNRWAQKSFKEYKIGDEFEFKSTQDKNAVAIWRIKYDVLEAIEKVIELLGGLEINPQTKILILPTLISPKHPYFAVNTNPKFLESLINYLVKIGGDIKSIKVAAQSFDEIPIEASAQKSQLLDVCLHHQIAPLDLAKGNFVKKTQNNFTFEISEEVFNTDLIINLPILKLDSKLGVRAARENTLKFLKKESYLSLQYLHSQEEIIEKLQEMLPNYLTIADGLTIQKTTGLTTFLGLTLASFNSLNLDRVFAEITLLGDLSEYLKKVKIEDIPIAGRTIEEVQYNPEKI
ncbi:MAG: DUF362 domain-containing protein [Candidatus Nealsonbacteria bacterium]|nr:MAG: DUF362 domain-containing protein [Candidatus Nealsonbacteria bacterium]